MGFDRNPIDLGKVTGNILPTSHWSEALVARDRPPELREETTMRNILAGVAALALTIGLTVSAEAANNPPKIGLVQIDLSNPFHLGEVVGAKEAARRAGFELIVT